MSRPLLLAAALALASLTTAAGSGTAPARAAARGHPVPVLAYYYIWYEPSSWSRAKSDYPLAGRYSSDDRRVMRDHVRWAREAGIEGFIVSWKSTPTLDERLARLAAIADAQRFKLAVIYQGLDFNRNPLPLDKVSADLSAFARRYARDPAFNLFGRPVVIWGGTWRFTRHAIARVTSGLRGRLLVLGSARTAAGYRRIADSVAGDAYYWSSVNPYSHDRYRERLAAMGRVVHALGGLWIAPAAPGFDARLIGGREVVPRKDGETLRREWDAALASTPDAIGLISWNEFSENSQIEPSLRYGSRYLRVVAGILGAPAPSIANFDSSAPGQVTGVAYGLPVIGGFVVLLVGGVALGAWRARRRPPRRPDGGTRNSGGSSASAQGGPR
jgi:hypothetical protein